MRKKESAKIIKFPKRAKNSPNQPDGIVFVAEDVPVEKDTLVIEILRRTQTPRTVIRWDNKLDVESVRQILNDAMFIMNQDFDGSGGS